LEDRARLKASLHLCTGRAIDQMMNQMKMKMLTTSKRTQGDHDGGGIKAVSKPVCKTLIVIAALIFQ
jgi:hypothetical protein